MSLPAILPPQLVPPLLQDPEEDRGPFDPPVFGKTFTDIWYQFFYALVTQLMSSGGQEMSITLAAGLNTIVGPPVLQGSFLVVFMDNPTGTATIVWDSSFSATTSVNINIAANKSTTFVFFGKTDDKWWPTAYPVLEE